MHIGCALMQWNSYDRGTAAETVCSQDVAAFFRRRHHNVPEAQSQLFALMFSSYSPVASIVQSSCLKCVEVVLVIFAISHKRANYQFALSPSAH